MAVLKAKSLKSALERARKVGLVEEAVTVAGCPLVLRSLTPEEYEAINDEVKDLEEVAYLHGFQIGHLSRAIVEIDGVDLRDVDLVEVEEGDKPVKLEKHAWLRENFLKTWSREAILAGWRKLLEVLAASDARAKEGITFSIAEETDEEKFRRLLGEMKEAGSELPNELVVKVLDDEGFILKSTKAELDSAAEKLAEVQAPEEAPKAPEEVPQTPAAKAESAEALMRNRVPMNQGAVEVPSPPQAAAPVMTSSRKVEVPAAIKDAAVSTQALSRAAQIAALEGGGHEGPVAPVQGRTEAAAVELRRPGTPDPKGVAAILDRPPTAGLNPRYQPPRRV